jgi:nucleoside-diphosphate-sugar epimerase
MKKVFVTGATGVLGKRVLRHLIENGNLVNALSRSVENDAIITDLGANPVQADIFDPKQMINATQGSDIIMHLATAIPQKGIPNKPVDWEMNDRLRIHGTKYLLKAAIENGIECFIQQSVTYIYGNRNGNYIDPETPIGSRLPFMVQSAVEMEKVIRAETNVNHIILRFGSFYSQDSISTIKLTEGVRKRKMPIVGKGDYYWNNIHVDDAANAVLYVFRNRRRLANTTINFTDFAPMTFKDMMLELVNLTSGKKPFIMPKFLSRVILKRDLYEFITASVRIKQDELVQDWQPVYACFTTGMRKILTANRPA